MDSIKELVEQGQFTQAIAIPEEKLTPRELFFRVSALLALGKGEEAMDTLVRHRDELYAEDPLLTLKANFETRFILKQFDQAEQDRIYFESLPYVRQEVEEVLRTLPSTIAATRYATVAPRKDLEELLQNLASPSDDLMLLSTLNALQKVGELEDYRQLVEELLVGPHHDDVKTYALMLLSAKGSTQEVTFVKRGKSYRVVPNRLGSPFALPEYREVRKKIESCPDASLLEVAGELLDLYCLILYPERAFLPEEAEDFAAGLFALGREYLGQGAQVVTGKAKEWKDRIGQTIAENPPLLG